MLSLQELRRASAVIDARFSGHRLERIVQRDPQSLVLTLYGTDALDGSASKRHLILSCAPAVARVSEGSESVRAPEAPPAFQNFLKARLLPSRLVAARLLGEDRQLVLRFESPEGAFDLLLALMGNRSNLYLLAADGTLLAALRPLEQTRRALSIGSSWEDPPPQTQVAAGAERDRWASSPEFEFLAAIESEYVSLESEGEAEGVAREIRRGLRKERKLARRRLARIQSELGEADGVTTLQRDGELLKVSLGRVEAGASELRTRDFETGEEVVISLDPGKSPQQNLKAIFKRYQKLVRRLAKAGTQIDRAQQRDEELEGLEQRFEALVSEAGDLSEFAGRPEVQEILRRHASRGRPAAAVLEVDRRPAALKNVPRRLLPRRYRSRDGLEIWVGRSDEGNDLLSTRLARGNDLFFHLDGAPGSHVVLRTEGRKDPPSESLLDACELAVNFSKFKNARSAEVHVVPIKQVKKPKGAKKGLVYVTGGRSLHLRREATRLERLMAARIDD